MKLSVTDRRPSPMSKTRSRKKKHPRVSSPLPGLEHARTAVLNSLASTSCQRTHDHAIREFVDRTVRCPGE